MGLAKFLFIATQILVICNVYCDRHCGYEACPKIDPSKLTVHLVPHTHDDVGWVKTVDEYYHGINMSTFNTGVKSIIESVIGQLVLDPTRKFIWVETAYFWKWWTSQKNETLRDVVRKLVAQGQLEMTGGAWSMNDEAVTHYQSTIDQFTWGFRRLSDIFGDCGRPHVGWQIDPFGHSRETASLMAQLGFDGLFFGRLDLDDKANRLKTKSAELIWRGSVDLGEESDLFTGVLYNQYSPPRGFCFDRWCADYINDEINNTRNNVKEKIDDFLVKAKAQASHYATKNVIWTMGMDFHYMVAEKWYTNMDTLMKHVNEISNETGVVAVYSTPSCYLQALHASNLKWPTKSDDFFPYASENHTYWTGYFTSRPNLKRFERQGNNLLQVCKQMHVFGELGETDNLISLREAMGVLQHHDAITGTEKQYVADDYARILHEAMSNCDVVNTNVLSVLMNAEEELQFKRCPLLNISQCDVSENARSFIVTVYNPLARRVNKFVRIPIKTEKLIVTDVTSGDELEVQYLPIPLGVKNVPGRESEAIYEAVFEAVEIPALGFKSYHVENVAITRHFFRKLTGPENSYAISNEFLKVKIDPVTRTLSSVELNGKEVPISQNLFYYRSGSKEYTDEKHLRASGAYIFRPNSTIPENVAIDRIQVQFYKGPLVQEIHQTFSSWASQVIRIYKGQKHVEIEWLVGPIPKRGDVGKEVISWFSTNLDTQGKFYTDSNSREYLTRRRDLRDTWKAKILEPVAGNYYPITSGISIHDDETKVAILTDRAQAGGSIFDGTLELMLHRRLFEDDGYGVNEALNEIAFGHPLVTRGKLIVLIGPTKGDINVRQRDIIQKEMVLDPTLFFMETDLTAQEWNANYTTEFSAISADLPANVNILTLEPWRGGTILLRLEHFIEKKDDPENLSKPTSVKLQGLFGTVKVKSVTEMNLGVNQKQKDMKRFAWNSKTTKKKEKRRPAPARNSVEAANNYTVVLHPMQIRTFVLEIE